MTPSQIHTYEKRNANENHCQQKTSQSSVYPRFRPDSEVTQEVTLDSALSTRKIKRPALMIATRPCHANAALAAIADAVQETRTALLEANALDLAAERGEALARLLTDLNSMTIASTDARRTQDSAVFVGPIGGIEGSSPWSRAPGWKTCSSGLDWHHLRVTSNVTIDAASLCLSPVTRQALGGSRPFAQTWQAERIKRGLMAAGLPEDVVRLSIPPTVVPPAMGARGW